MGFSAAAAAALLGAKGAYDSASAQKDALGTQAGVAERNAQLSGAQADQALQVGAAAEQSQRLKTAALVSSQRAQMAANGVDLGVGSATDVLSSSAYMGSRDALTIRDNATRQAWAYRVQQQNNIDAAAQYRRGAGNINPTTAALTSLLGSSGQVSSAWSSGAPKTPPATP